MLMDSERPSAIASDNIPPNTANFECVPELKPAIRPNVVIVHEVVPKLNPVLNDSFINVW